MPESPLPETLLRPEIVEDPHPTLARLRVEAPIYRDDLIGAWLVTRHADVKALFADPRLSNDRRKSPRYEPPPRDSWAYTFDQTRLFSGTPAEHRAMRARISAGFTPRAVRRQAQQVRDVVEQFAAPLRGRTGTIDLLATFTNPIPNTVISRITGIPPYPGEEDRFRRLAQNVIRRFFPLADAENIAIGEAAIGELAEWVGKLADQRRAEPEEDLLSDLIAGHEGEDGMTDLQIVMLIVGLVAAGSETTTLGGTHVLRLLLEHPEQMARLRAQPQLAENAVRETLRFGFGSVAGMPRFALEDIELHGTTIREGDMVMLSSSAANRDESVFDDPQRFDIERDTRESLAFGNGPHYCLGANLALQEMTCMLDAALDFLPEDATLDATAIEWESIGLMRRPASLPVRFV